MARPAGERNRLRERAVLAVALVACLGLLGAAVSSFGDPDLAARSALRRLAETVAGSVRAEWRQMLAGEGPGPPAGEVFRWSEGLDLAARGALPRGGAGAGDSSETVDLLLATARARELREADLEGALSLVEEARARSDAGEHQRARGLLRELQLCARLGRSERVRELWAEARESVAGDLGEGDTSILLLCALAAAPALEEGELAEARDELCGRWARGELALPEGGERLVAGEVAPLRISVERSAHLDVLREALEGLAPGEAAERRLAAWFEGRRIAALERALGGLPSPTGGGRWQLASTRMGPFACRAASGGDREGFFVALADCRAELRRRVEAGDHLPEGFELDFAMTDESLGVDVAAPVSLWGEELGFALRHRDPDGAVRGARRRTWLLRGALALMGLFCGALGLFTFRALRRERRLQELKVRFVANVSHELRTPLASILLLAENLEEGRAAGPDRGRRYGGLIRSEAARLRRLVDDVLDFSRIERGRRPELVREELELAPFFAELARELAAREVGEGERIRCRFEDLPESAALDAEALRRAIWNLVDNALRHGGGEVEVSAGAAGGGLRLSVRDFGPGVPDACRERIFRPFERLGDEGERGSAPGTGLGLAIVREIARAHGGEVSVADPAEGPGAVFELDIPLGGGGGGEAGA